jgi:hypothetical protein
MNTPSYPIKAVDSKREASLPRDNPALRILYFILIVVFFVIEYHRQQHFNNFIFSATADSIVGFLFVVYVRRFSWLFWGSAVAASTMAFGHWLASNNISLVQSFYCAKSLPITVGCIEVISLNERTPIEDRWVRIGLKWLAVAAIAFAIYAMNQRLFGFTYAETDNPYNMVEAGTGGGLRLPSIFFSYGNYARFNLASGILLLWGLKKRKLGIVWGGVGFGAVLLGLVLSGQRVALVAMVAILVLWGGFSIRILATDLAIVVVLIAVTSWTDISSIEGHIEYAKSGFTTERIISQFGQSFVDWFAGTPWLGWGFGAMGGGGFVRLASADYSAPDFTYAYSPDTVLEGMVPYFLLSGGVVWLAVNVLAMAWAFRNASVVGRQLLFALVSWGLVHCVFDSTYAFVFVVLFSGALTGIFSESERPVVPLGGQRKIQKSTASLRA